MLREDFRGEKKYKPGFVTRYFLTLPHFMMPILTNSNIILAYNFVIF